MLSSIVDVNYEYIREEHKCFNILFILLLTKGIAMHRVFFN